MDLEKIKAIVNSDISKEHQESLIVTVLSQDKNVIPNILNLLERERIQQKELLLDTNLELSRALVIMNKNPESRSAKKIINEERIFVVEEIKKHYKK